MKKLFKGVAIVALCLVLVVVGLILNNRICYAMYDKADVDLEVLTDAELETAASIFAYLSDHGGAIFDGFGELTELLLYNRTYEFLLTDGVYEQGWETLGADGRTGKTVYRRLSEDPKAFAVKIGDRWAGSFCTQAYYPVSLLEQVPVFVPPQLFLLDDIAYRSVVVHEMAHALQGNRDNSRLEQVEGLHNVNSRYDGDRDFNAFMKKEGKLLEEAMSLTDHNELVSKAGEFLASRDSRRTDCGMTAQEISDEKEYEWLEGSGRYTEYIAADGSRTTSSRGLDQNIAQKAAAQGVDRYYALGMAQIVLIRNLDIPDWQPKLFYQQYAPEDVLREYLRK